MHNKDTFSDLGVVTVLRAQLLVFQKYIPHRNKYIQGSCSFLFKMLDCLGITQKARHWKTLKFSES